MELGVDERRAQQRRDHVRQVRRELFAQALADAPARLQHELDLRVVWVERLRLLSLDNEVHDLLGVGLKGRVAHGDADERDALHGLAAQHAELLATRQL